MRRIHFNADNVPSPSEAIALIALIVGHGWCRPNVSWTFDPINKAAEE